MIPEQFALSVPCDRCKRPYQGADDADGWIYRTAHGYVITVLCLRCQTPEEYAEAALSDAIRAHQEEQIQNTLEELVADGILEKITRPDGVVAYRATKNRSS
jgi:hypothetical protein